MPMSIPWHFVERDTESLSPTLRRPGFTSLSLISSSVNEGMNSVSLIGFLLPFNEVVYKKGLRSAWDEGSPQ